MCPSWTQKRTARAPKPSGPAHGRKGGISHVSAVEMWKTLCKSAGLYLDVAQGAPCKIRNGCGFE